MQISASFFDVCRQFFETGIILPVFLIALLYLYRKWNKEKRFFFLVLCIVGICLVFNEVMYRVANFVGESETYYRLLWICPMALIIACCIIDMVVSAEKRIRILLAFALIVGVVMFSQRPYTTWFPDAENIYQLDDDVVQVADAIMKLTEGEPATLVDNANISDTIRQYNANIQYPVGPMEFLYNSLYGVNTDYLGRYLQDYLDETHPRFLALQKETVETYRIFESAGVGYVGETDNYLLFMVNYEGIYVDQDLLDEYEDASQCKANVEYIPIRFMGNEQNFFYVSTLNEEKGSEEHRAMVDCINQSGIDYVIINNPNIEDNVLEELKVPYYCNNQEFQVIEMKEYNICLIDNSGEVTSATTDMLRELYREEKEIILVLSEELQEDNENELYRAIASEESKICEILSVSETEYQKGLVYGDILQYATPKENGTILNIVRVIGTERE